jgi:hypothetical protein
LQTLHTPVRSQEVATRLCPGLLNYAPSINRLFDSADFVAFSSLGSLRDKAERQQKSYNAYLKSCEKQVPSTGNQRGSLFFTT